ncbi:Glycerophosphodiester phosphodiesterase [Bacillus velezensis]|nr:Glycerophosphodiester phosphodiesterase [Bacillus velezensis]
MPAFKKAIEDGADGIELDVQMTKDGRIVVIHDETLDRTTSLKGFVKDTAYDKIRTADAAGKWKDAFKGVRIPLLSDVLRFAERADFLINIELKNSVFRYEGMEEEVIKKSDITDWKSALFFLHLIMRVSRFATPWRLKLNGRC